MALHRARQTAGNAEWRFLTYLFSIGRERADKWLTDNFGSIGSKSTIDLDDKYM
jgi:NTE family protein